MPRTRSVLDSPAVELPNKRKPVAAPSGPSASKSKPKERLAPVQALPTPPATRKRKRARSRITDSDTEEDEELPVLDSSDKEESKVAKGREDVVVLGHKKRRTFKLDAIAEELSRRAEEDAFWTGDSSASILPIVPKSVKATQAATAKEVERGRSRTRSPTRSPSSSPPAHLLRRNRTGLFSPPPSRRHPKTVIVPCLVTPPPLPRTPQPKRKAKARKAAPINKKLFPERDSPNNPFLADESPDGVASGSSLTPNLTTPEPYVEKPTITMVYRGVKHEFINPLYDPDAPNGVASLRNSPSRLPPSDPDFSPTPYCPPKLLFPEARKRNHARLRSRTRASASPSPAADVFSGDGEGAEPEPEKLVLPSTPKKGKGKAKATEFEQLTPKPPAKVKAKQQQKSEWDSSDDEVERSLPEPRLRRSPRLNGRVKDVGYSPQASHAKKAERTERGRTKNVKEVAKLAPLLFASSD